VLHTAVATANWNDEFGDAVEAILEGAREGARAGQVSKHSEEAKAIERKALVLVKHPSFNHGRVSFDKRLALAETLFQDCDPHTLSETTRRAENLFWLEQSGVKLDGI
jgi:CHAD domain-containing protein